MSLFRKQVTAKQHDKLWGQVHLSQPLSYKVLSMLFISIVCTALSFLSFNEYNRKERVSGVILPESGVTQIFSPGNLLVTKQYVQQGQEVKKGQVLFQLSAPLQIGSGKDEKDIRLKELTKQIAILKQQTDRFKTQEKQELIHLTKIETEQVSQKHLLVQELNSALSRKSIYQARLDKHMAIQKQGLISENLIAQLQEQLLTIQQEVHLAKRLVKQIEQQLQQTRFKITQLPTETQQKLEQITLSISEKEQQIASVEAASNIIVTAPINGRLAALDINQNQWLLPQQYMVSILPKSLALHAELHIPTHAYGFIKEGQKARVKLNAFPFEKFGYLTGSVISKSSHTNYQTNNLTAESVYKVKVKLDKQTMTAYGKEVALQSGMRLSADILIDKRTLIEWLLAPLYSLKG